MCAKFWKLIQSYKKFFSQTNVSDELYLINFKQTIPAYGLIRRGLSEHIINFYFL